MLNAIKPRENIKIDYINTNKERYCTKDPHLKLHFLLRQTHQFDFLPPCNSSFSFLALFSEYTRQRDGMGEEERKSEKNERLKERKGYESEDVREIE